MVGEIFERQMLPEVRRALASHRIVSLVGARQVGKSTLVKHLVDERPKDVDLIDLDNAAARSRLSSDPMTYLDRPGRTVIIDEAQRVPDLMLLLKAEVDRDPRPGRFLLTGSADLWAVQEPGVRDSLAGRMHRMRLWGLSQGELEGFTPHAVDALLAGDEPVGHTSMLDRGSYLRRAVAGGFPEVVGAGTSKRSEWLRSYAESRTREDATDVGARRRYLSELPVLLALLASRSAQELNVAGLAQSFVVSERSLPAYVDILEQLYLIDRIPAWSRNMARRVTNKPKTIISDSGLMAALLDLRPVGSRGLNHDNMAGPLLETFVAGEVLRSVVLAVTPISVRHLRRHDGVEVDLVLEADDGRVIGIEVKAAGGARRDDGRGLRTMRDALGPEFVAGLVLHTGSESRKLEDRIFACPIDVLWRWPGRPKEPAPPEQTERPPLSQPRIRRSAPTEDVPEEIVSVEEEDAVPGPQLFIGYARTDEEATGAITTIEEGVGRAFRAITTPAQDLKIFRDVSSLRWGDDWQKEIDVALDDSSFYVPVLSPRFFDSQGCRDEAEKFLGRVQRDPARRSRLVLPVLLIDVPDLRSESTDLLKAKLAAYQRIDLREHVASAPSDPALKRLIWSMAATLNERILEADPPPIKVGGVVDDVDDELDLAEMMLLFGAVEVDGESIALHLGEVMDALSEFFEVLGLDADPREVQRAAAEASRHVDAPLTAAEEAVANVAATVRQFDSFIVNLTDLVAAGAISPQDLSDLADQFEAIDIDLGDMGQVRQVMKVIGFTSRDLRAPMRRLDAVMVGFGDIVERIQRWGPTLRAARGEASG